MAFLSIKHVSLKGVSACVPKHVEYNAHYPWLNKEEINKYIETTGIKKRHCGPGDGSLCTSDLCYVAAEKVIAALGWEKSEIELLIFVSHTADYKLPSTACILQNRLGLSKECMTFDVPYGCSGYVYGLGLASNLLSSGCLKKALLLVGNTQSVYASPEDRSTTLLFGDAGTATALAYDSENRDTITCHYATDGSKYDILIVPDGGCRNPVHAGSFVMEEFDEGIKRSRLHEMMDGPAVFAFTLSEVPRSLKALLKKFEIEFESIDYLLLHQANKFLCEKIRKKMGFEPEKVPSNLESYGNTSGATLPLLMVTNLGEELQNRKLDLLLAGFGVGLSLGSVHLKTDKIVCPPLLYI